MKNLRKERREKEKKKKLLKKKLESQNNLSGALTVRVPVTDDATAAGQNIRINEFFMWNGIPNQSNVGQIENDKNSTRTNNANQHLPLPSKTCFLGVLMFFLNIF